ncbi:hypothetical protein [Salinarimonas chemoclinalis]|uniref:hypothetical protein n=1 Tax=Salinarimonas chemoclinalis TaxID=3241599 RepID=UPI003558A772
MSGRSSPPCAIVLRAAVSSAAIALTVAVSHAETRPAPFCPASLGDGAGLRSFAVFEVVGGERFELAPEIDGATLGWSIPAGAADATALSCAYEDGATVEITLPPGRGLACTAVWDEAAARYADAPRCAVSPAR